MTSPDDRPDPEAEERAWAELVKAFHTAPDDGGEQRWPAAEDLSPDDYAVPDTYVGPENDGDTAVLDGPEDAGDDGSDTIPGPRPAADEAPERVEADHFVPPPPPPLPRGDLISRLAWAGVGVPPAVILIAGLASVRVSTNLMAFLAIAFVTGFGVLVSRLRGRHPSDPDDGAVL